MIAGAALRAEILTDRYPEVLVAERLACQASAGDPNKEEQALVSEDFVSRHSKPLGRFGYMSLGSTTLGQLKKSRFVRSALQPDEERRKPDGIVFLPMGGIKAVVEVKQSSELAGKKLESVVKDYSPIARAVCNLLIITDGKKSFWYNPHTKNPAIGPDGNEIRELFDPAAIDDRKLSREVEARVVSLIEIADFSLHAGNDNFQELKVIDPSSLARSVWQKIWVNTGKDPEKCLYNVVEILVFKFLSDAGVLSGQHSFRRLIELLSEESDGAQSALEHYAQISRNRIRKLFPEGSDRTTVINGTIFVNERGAPNFSQASLFKEVLEAFQNFDDEAGSLRYIDRQFKTRLYESFLRQQAGIRSLGQYFTPRNVVQAMVRMSKAGQLQKGARICDPFCGVGGFLLEAIVDNKNLWDQYVPHNGRIYPEIIVRGYDKGTDEKEDERTIILAKANMLVYMSDLLVEYNSEEYLRKFAENAFNDVFQLIRSNLGTFERVDEDENYDLILTNPPYVTSGSASLKNAIEASEELKKKYTAGGRGTESLAIQWIISHLRDHGTAFVVVPDGLMNQASMLAYIKSECFVRAVVALPSRTFYSTPKKTYILALEKHDPGAIQTDPVFTYLVSEIGESRDARRISIDANDLTDMQVQFRYFETNRRGFKYTDPRCRVVEWNSFGALSNWLIDRLWTREDKIALGILEESVEVDVPTFRGLVEDARRSLDDLLGELQ